MISAKLAGRILLSLMALLTIFHLLILFKIIPSDIVWGGKVIDGSTNINMMELIAIIVTLVFIVIITMKTYYLESIRFRKAINIAIWIIFVYMVLNTLGNLMSDNIFEQLIFAPITFIMSLLTLRLAIEKQ